MLSLGVVIICPCGDLFAGVPHAHAQRLVEQFVANLPVEALYKGILRRLPWRRVVPLDVGFATPAQHRVRGQLGSVVRDDHAGLAAFGDEIGLDL